MVSTGWSLIINNLSDHNNSHQEIVLISGRVVWSQISQREHYDSNTLLARPTCREDIMQITNDIVKQDTNFTYKQDYRQYYSFIVIQSPGEVSNKNLIFYKI